MNIQQSSNDIADLYDKYAPALYGVIKNIVSDSTKAEDALMNVFHNLSDDMRNYKHKENLFVWLINLSRNEAISRLIDENTCTKAAPVNSFVTTLPVLQKTIFALVFFKGLRLDEIADVLNLPLGKVETICNGLPNFTPYLFPNIKKVGSPISEILQSLMQNIIPENDAQRLAALRKYQLIYTPAEEVFDKLTQMTARVFDTPMCFLSLVDEDTVFYKSQVGSFGRTQVNRKDSLCSLTILSKEPLIIEDASLSNCFKDNPFVSAENGIKFYAGVPLITRDGYHIGALCVVDIKPRTFSTKDILLLTEIAEIAMLEIESRHENFQEILLQEQVEKAKEHLYC